MIGSKKTDKFVVHTKRKVCSIFANILGQQAAYFFVRMEFSRGKVTNLLTFSPLDYFPISFINIHWKCSQRTGDSQKREKSQSDGDFGHKSHQGEGVFSLKLSECTQGVIAAISRDLWPSLNNTTYIAVSSVFITSRAAEASEIFFVLLQDYFSKEHKLSGEGSKADNCSSAAA